MPIQLPKRNFRGYIFDCDGTLADSMPIHLLAWNQALVKTGKSIPEELFYHWGGRTTTHMVESLNEKFNWNLDVPATAQEKENCYLELLSQVQPIVDVVDLVHTFYGKVPLAVASGGYRKMVMATLEALKLIQFFETIVCAEDCQRGKPAPDPFLEAARRMGLAPGDCLVFEDSPTGLAAATAAGMECVLVPRGGKLIGQVF